jgi:amino acid adenylation domain-containing protein/non-ribosomal peptide synthase protein (TIGR01720 family)
MSKALIEDIYPLSPLQQGMLFHALLAPETDVYLRQVSYGIDAPLDVQAFESAWQSVVDRHPALRTCFAWERQDEPQQVVLRRVKLPVDRHDLRNLDEAGQKREIEELLAAGRSRPFKLSKAPLLRLTEAELAPDRFFCIFTYHHLLLDGWSLARVFAEVAEAYRAAVEGRPASFPPSRPYRDYIAWVRRQDMGTAEAFWRGELAGFTAPTPLDLGRGAEPGPVDLDTRLPAADAAALRAPLARAGLTPSTLVYGGWALLLHRLSGAPDLVFGAVFSGRPEELPDAGSIVGLMINTLPVRVQINPGERLLSWLRRLQENRLRLHRFEHTPLPLVQRWSEVGGGAPLFDSLLIFENFPRAAISPGEPAAVSHLRTLEATNYPLTLLAELSDELSLRAACGAGRFAPAAVAGLLRRFAALLAALAADFERPIADVPLLTPEERQQVLVEWNDTVAAGPPGPTVVHLFERQAALSPDALAVEMGDERLTYAELHARAGRLARHLRALGVGPEGLVGLCAEPSLDMVVGLFGILLAGGAYVPLDPDYPRERLALMVEDSGAAVLLAQERLLSRLPAGSARVAFLDSPGTALEPGAPLPEALAAGRAYVLYTSGSTGRPKGVQVCHGSLANFLWSMRERPGFVPGQRLLAVTSLSFDIAGLELYLPLVSGGTLVLAGREASRDGGRLAALLDEQKIDVLQATPGAWRLLLEAGWRGREGLTALSGGEALPADLARQMAVRAGSVWNLYGPTETTIWSAVHQVRAQDDAPGPGWVPIGRPITGTWMGCAGPDLQPLPAGVPGELAIGGAGLARGYLGRPDLTAASFVPHPGSAEPGARLYLTGDVARALPDGTLEYLGRRDHQVKVRGVRIELGEIEAALCRYPGVREAVAAVREAGAGDRRLVAYLAAEPGPDPAELRAFLRQRLPDPMVPAAFVSLPALPRTPNGKVDRKVLPDPWNVAGAPSAAAEPQSAVERTIAGIWAEVLRVERVGLADNFFDLGGHSLLLMRVRHRLEEALGRPVELLDLFRHPTASALAGALSPPAAAEPEEDSAPTAPRRAAVRRRAVGERSASVAIVGMAGRFPGARDLAGFWANLAAGVESIRFFSDEELRAAGVAEETLRDPSYVKAKGFLDEAEGFDAAFFGLLPRDAELMDPQHRVFLECAWEALEDAGCEPTAFAGAIGVYAGASLNTYWLHMPPLGPVGLYQAMIANDKDFLATRLSYKLDLTGPSVSVQTACSTSLVAVHMAAQSLLAGECDLALAGGVTVAFPRTAGYFHSEGMILSPDGHCRAFDSGAQGTVFGEGVGAVVLKRLEEALADGDTVRAVIRGSAVNNDGAGKVSYTAPSVSGQARVVAEAMEVAGVGPETVAYVEAHGTGTPLGDPIEIAALSEAFGAAPGRGACALGSVKANVGHLDAAAGIAGLLKTVLALEHGALPPHLHFRRPNAEIDFAASPFYINTELRPWPAAGGPRRAGVSSFGIGGTNAHVVLEQAPTLPARPAADPSEEHLLVVSARTLAALERATDRLAAHLAAHPGLDPADVAWTLASGRRAFAHRRTLACRDLADAAEALAERAPERLATDFREGGERPVVALFPGQGAQRAGMGQELYRREPAFRAEVDLCAETLRPLLGLDIRGLFDPGPEEGTEERLRQTGLAQPALFVVELALAKLLRRLGIRPRAMIGHSLGEYVAACLAGVFTVEEGLSLIAARGRLMEQLPGGTMLDIKLPEEELLPLLGGGLCLAAVNAPSRTTVSGPGEAVAALEQQLGERGVSTRRVATSHAFHSGMMEPVLAPFRAEIGKVRLQPPRIPFLSNLTGTWIRPEEATDPEYWLRHLRQPVRFAAGIEELLAEPDSLLLEIGPGETLTGLVRQHPAAASRAVFSVLPGKRGAAAGNPLLPALGRLWREGVAVDWAGGRSGRPPRKIPLPTYPFERQRYSLERPGQTFVPAAPPPRPEPALPASGSRRERIFEVLSGIVQALSGLASDQIDPRSSFVEAGVDSLLLIQFGEAVRGRLGVQLSVTQLLEEFVTLEALVAWLDRELPADAFPEAAPVPSTPAPAAAGPAPYVPFQPLEPGLEDELNPVQRGSLDLLIERYTARTAGSKRRTQEGRTVLADNRTSVDFRLPWKEMVYPIVADRSAGSRVWDVDGNEYVDVAMGFGVNLFGHAPVFVGEAIAAQLAKGIQLGPQSELAVEVAAEVAALTGMERVAFSNTGTEAVMTALRLARAATGRSRIALFAGSYHGSFDGVLARGLGDETRALPLAPGVLPRFVDDLLVLPYGEPASLEVLRSTARDLAGVLVEPVQSRRPDLQPREFLHDLRRITREAGAALIFDEVITGFRIHPGGAQAWFGVEADLATYGKVIGGGLPIGLVAGRAAFLDAIDGGFWAFGDRSYPRAGKTFFAGTFCKHPLTLAAARAVARHLRQSGPALQETLNRRTAELAGRLNGWFREERLPIRTVNFGSLFRFVLPPDLPYGSLFFFHLLERGVFNWEGRTCFLSTAHTDKDVEAVVAAVQESALALCDGGFLPREAPAFPASAVPSPAPPVTLPSTDAQRQLWFLAQMDEDASRAYNESVALRLAGDLRPAVLEAALGRAAARHEALRTTFSADGGQRRIAAALHLGMPLADLSGLPAGRREAEARVLLRGEGSRCFDLERGPLVRTLLVRLAARGHVLCLTCHHVVLDGRSLGLLRQELDALYQAGISGTLPGLPPPARLAGSLRRDGEGAAADRALGYWLEEFADSVPALDLPYDRPRPPFPTYRGGYRTLILGEPARAGARALGAGHGATLFTVLLAVCCAWLHRLSGQDDLVAGFPATGATELERAQLDYDLALLPLRSRPASGATFAGFLAALGRKAREGYEHREVSFTALIKGLSLSPGSRQPLVSVVFNTDRGERRSAFGDLEMELATNPTGGARFEIFLNAVDRGSDLMLECEHNADLFDGATVDRFLGNFEALLEGAAAAPRARLAELPLLRQGERHQLLWEWNDTDAGYDREALIHRLFEAQAARTPGAVAAVFQGGEITYAELDRLANRLAHRLARLGAGPGDLVAVYVPRTPELLVAVLGILKAGAAYVPLAGSFPPARRRWILERLAVRCLLTHTARLPELEETVRDLPALGHLLCLDEKEAGLGSLPDHAPPCRAEAEDTAYIIFTSGSTGTPKGVVVRHRPAVNLIEWVNRTFSVGPADRVLFVTALSFDLSVYDVFGLLAAGGSVRIASEADLEDPARLVGILRREPVTFWDSAPAALQQLAPLFPPPGEMPAPALRLVFLSGDWVPLGLPDAVRASFPKAAVVALGGATEATVWSNFFPVAEVDRRWASIPYGRPIQNATYHVLDPALSPCPVGVAGDLAIGGECLASGYAAEPELTARKFIPDPWSRLPGGRMYLTGDRARRFGSGVLEFLGRLDHQVKIRGFRIELGEIEATLLQHPGVRHAVAVVREDRPGQRRLAAYAVPGAGPEPTPPELLDFLARRLPDYMVPAALVVIAELPVTANGKLDRGALPAPEGAGGAREQAYACPRSHEEEVLAAIWAELLGVERVGIHDRFFELGGDSILSIQAVSRAGRAGLKITPRQIYQLQTVAALAAAAASADTAEAPAAEQGEVTGEVPPTPAACWLLDPGPADPHHFNQSVFLMSRRLLSPAVLARATAALLAHHDALRLRCMHGGTAWRQRIAGIAETSVPFVHLDLRALPPGDRGRAITVAAAALQASLDLARGPLLRVALFQAGGGEPDRLLIVIHHLAVDGVSWRILLEDLAAACDNLALGAAPGLPAKTASFKQWAEELAAQAVSAASSGLPARAAYWLAGSRAGAGRLPLDFPGGVDCVASASSVEAALGREETQALLQEVPAAYNTRIEDALLTALVQAFAPWTGAPGLWIELEGHGRGEGEEGDLDLSRTVGWFTTLFPVYLTADGAAGPGEALKSVKEQLRAVPERGLPYGLLLHLGQDREARARLRGLPPPEVIFNYLGQLDRALDAGSPFSPAPEPAGAERSPRQLRPYRIEINGSILDGRLQLSWSYGAEVFRRGTIEALAERFTAALRALIAHCRSAEEGGFTASDFPLAGLDRAGADHLSAALAAAEGVSVPAAARNTEDVYPLSPLQESMLFHTLVAPGSQAGVEQLCLALEGELDQEVFERTWLRVLARHGALRTAFFADGLARPLQVVRKAVSLPFSLFDWRGMDPEDRDRRLADFLTADREKGFRLDRAPLLRLSVLRFGDRSWRLVWTHHHLILDGWCRALVLDEVFATHAALGRGEEPVFPDPRPFRDYVAWLGRQDPEAAAGFWRRTFEGFTGTPQLPLSRLPEATCIGGGAASRVLPPDSAGRLRAAAQGFGVTLSTLAQAAWALLLARYSGGEDVTFGAAVSGRPPDLPGVESMVGMFVNNLPVRVRMPSGERLGPWLVRLQDWQQELRQFEHSPLADVQGWSGLPAGRRLFESLVVFQNYPAAPAGEEPTDEIGGLGLALHSASLETNYPLTLVVEPGDGLTLSLACQLLDTAAAARALGHLETLLEGMAAAGPESGLAGLPLLTAAEREEILALETAPPGGPLWTVLDAGGQPLPAGIPGELAVVLPGGGVRRTGERARRLPGGGIEALGAGEPATPGAVTAGEVEALLRRHPQVLGAAVADRATPGRVAWISPDPLRPPTAAELRAELRKLLPERDLPSAFVFLPDLPRAAGGRLDRSALPEPGPAEPRRPHVPPRDALELSLARLWEELFDLAPVGVRDDFFELGGHSLLAVRLMAEMRARFGRDLPLATLFGQPTVESMAAALRQGEELPWSPLVPIQPGTPPLAAPGPAPLFLFHPSGGGVLGYAELARRLGPEQPVYGLQAFGLEAGQLPVPSLSGMAASYVESIRQAHPAGPYFLGGSSFGAYLAYEAACLLAEAGEEVALVALLDAPVPRGEEKPDPREYLGILVRELLPNFAHGLPGDLGLDGQLAWILEVLKKEDLVVAGFEIADLRRYFDLYWTNVNASLSWVPRPYAGPAVLLRARDNPEPPPGAWPGPALGWSGLALGGVEIHDVPGNHFNLLEPPHVQALAAVLRGLLDRPAASRTAPFPPATTEYAPETINS